MDVAVPGNSGHSIVERIMIRSLVIRQIFRLLDVALALAVVGAGVLVVKLFLTPLPLVEVQEAGEVPEADAASIVRGVGDRSAYDGLSKSGLFGSAGRWDAEEAGEPAPEAAVTEDIAESTLNLKLRGTIALKPGDPFSSAFIENMDTRDGVRSYLLKQEVVEGVAVDTIYQREIILLNTLKNPPQRERLRMEEDAVPDAPGTGGPALASARRPIPGTAPAGRGATPAPGSGSVQHTKLKRDSIVREAMENFATLSKITPEVKTDDAGNVLGVTAEGIGQHPLAQKLGFQDGDVLQTVNNERIDSRERLMEIFERYQNSSSFRVGILRNGQPNVLVFDVE